MDAVTLGLAKAAINARTITGQTVTFTAAGTLSIGKHNLVNGTTVGAFTVTLPAPTIIGQRLTVEKTDGTAAVPGPTVTVAGTIRGVSSSIPMTLVNETLVFVAESLTSWRPESGHKTLGSLDGHSDTRYSGASTVFVSPAGSDSNSGKAAGLAKATIAGALGVVTSGGRITLARGTHTVAARLPLVSNIEIVGESGTIIQAQSGITTSAIIGLSGAAVTGVTIRNITVDCNSLANVNGIQITTGTFNTIDNVTIINPGASCNGILISGGSDNVVKNSFLISTSTATTSAITIITSPRADVRNNFIRWRAGKGVSCLTSCHETDVVGNDIDMGGSGTQENIGFDYSSLRPLVAFNRCRNNTSDNGISVSSAEGARVIGNWVENAGHHGIAIGDGVPANMPYNGLVMGNIVKNSNQYSPTDGTTRGGISTQGGVNITVIGNRCYDDQATKTQDYGFKLSGGGSVTLMGNDFTGNKTADVNGITSDSTYIGSPGLALLPNGASGSLFSATGLTGATAASRYVGATAAGAPTSGVFLAGDFVIDQTGSIWICTVAGTPGTWVPSAGSAYVDPNMMTAGEETFSRDFLAGAAMTTSTQSLRLTYWTARRADVVTKVSTLTSAAAAATPTLCRIGIYTVNSSGNGTLVANVANDTTLWATAATRYVSNLASSYTTIAGQRYATALLVVTSATAPSFLAAGVGTSGPVELSLAPRLAGIITAQTDLPSTFLNSSVLNTSNGRAYSALLP